MRSTLRRSQWFLDKVGSGHSTRAWVTGWVGLATLAVANGAIREAILRDRTTEERAHQLSTVSLLGLSTAYSAALNRRWPLESEDEAWRVGACWAGMTVAFEFGFGHFVAGDSWSELLGAYDVSKRRLWVLVPAWLLVAPTVVRALQPQDSEVVAAP